jgi:hypothetical protein
MTAADRFASSTAERLPAPVIVKQAQAIAHETRSGDNFSR